MTMNKKGEANNLIGAFVILFITIMVGVILFQAGAQEVGRSTSTTSIINRSVTAGAAGTVIILTDVKTITGVTAFNASNVTQSIASSNYTVANNQVSNGNLVTTITTNAGPYSGAGQSWTISATYAEPVGYISDPAARQITGLIVIFFALAIAIVALTPTLRETFLEKIGR